MNARGKPKKSDVLTPYTYPSKTHEVTVDERENFSKSMNDAIYIYIYIASLWSMCDKVF